MWWGGLRGSVGLALSLTLLHASYDASMWGEEKFRKDATWEDGTTISFYTLSCRDQPFVIAYMTLWVVAFTVVINGLTMAPLMRFLKLTDIPDDRQFMLNEAYHHMHHKTKELIAELSKKPEFASVDWPLIEEQLLQPEPVPVQDEERAAWFAVLQMERANFLTQFEHGLLSAEGFHTLEHFIADLMAEATDPSNDLSDLYDEKFFTFFDKLAEEDFRAVNMMSRSIKYEVSVAYLSAMEAVGHNTHGKACYAKVMEQHKDNISKMEDARASFCDSKRQTVNEVNLDRWEIKQQRALTLALLEQRNMVDHMQHAGELTDLDAAPLRVQINGRINKEYSRNLCFKMHAGIHALKQRKTQAAGAAAADNNPQQVADTE